MEQWDLVVMAGGVGSRFGGLKQLEPVGPGGETLLDYSVFDALRAGAQRVVVVLRPETQAEFHERLGRRWAEQVQVDYAWQELDDVPPGAVVPTGRSTPWGTGHALLAARRAVRGPFVVINADDFYGAHGLALAAGFLATSPATPGRYALVAYRLAQTLSEHGAVSRGVCRLDGTGHLAGIDERKGVARASDGSLWSQGSEQPVPLAEDALVSMNLWALREDVFAHLEERFAAFLATGGSEEGAEFYLPAAITALIEAGLATVTVLPTPSPWFGLTHRADVASARRHLLRLVEEGAYPSRLWG